MSAKEPQINLFIAGSCRRKTGRGGWAALLQHPRRERLLSGGAIETTHNRLELEAAIQSLRVLKCPCVVTVCTTSEYLALGWQRMADWKRQGWKTAGRKPVMNADMWQAFEEAAREHQIIFEWVPNRHIFPELERLEDLARTECFNQASQSECAKDTGSGEV